MAIREYVGARYVPRFTGLYDATQVYDALDVVDNGAGTSYIAKKTVPAGTALTNTDYWFIYGATSGAILDLQDQINDIRATDLLLERRKLSEQSILMLGDSYERTTNFANYVCNMIGHGNLINLDSDGYVRASSNHKFFSSSKGSKCFTGDDTYGPGKNGVLTLLTMAASYMTDDEKANLERIAICLGISDSVYTINGPDYDRLPVEMENVRDYINATFPNAKVNTIFLGRVRGTFGDITADKLVVNVWRYQEYCSKYDFGYVTNSEYICFQTDGFTGPDNLHPVTGAGEMIAMYIMMGLATGSIDMRWLDDNVAFKFTPDSSVLTSGQISIFKALRNGVSSFKIATLDIAAHDTPLTLTYGQRTKIGTQNAFYAQKGVVLSFMANATPTNGGTFEMFKLQLEFEGYDVYLRNMGKCATPSNATCVIYALAGTGLHITFDLDTLYT